jgi:hypothetical protein
MKPIFKKTLLVAATLAMAGFAATAQALDQGTTKQLRPFVSGGVSIEEVKALEAERRNYQLWLVTVDQMSGAWLAGVQVAIRDAQGELVLDTKLDGPYLLVDLLPGRYAIEASLNGKTQRSSLLVSGRNLRQVLARFDTGAAVSPDMPESTTAPADSQDKVAME